MPVPWPQSHKLAGPSERNRFAYEEKAITLRQLRNLRDFIKRLCKAGLLKDPRTGGRLRWIEVNMHHIAALVVKPVISNGLKGDHCSWVEFVAKSPQRPLFFVSHNWAEPFRDFMDSIEIHSREHGVRDRDAYWICTFALDQFDVNVGLLLEDAPFIHGLKASKSGAVLMLDKTAASLTRIWCLLELNIILTKWQSLLGWPGPQLQIATPMGIVGTTRVSSGPIVEALAHADSKLCQASDPADRRQILNYIAGLEEGIGLESGPDGQIQAPKRLDSSMISQTNGEYDYEAQLLETHCDKFRDLDRGLKSSVGNLFSRERPQDLVRKMLSRRTIIANQSQLPQCFERSGAEVNRIKDVSQRGMTLAQLRTMMQHMEGLCPGWKTQDGQPLDWQSTTISDYEREFQKNQMSDELTHSYLEQVSTEGQTPEYFISVAYSCKLHVVIAAVEWHAEARGLPESTIYWSWFCSLSTQDLRNWDWSNRGNPTETILPIIDGFVIVVDAALETMKRANPAWDLYRLMFGDMSDKLCDLCCPSGVLATTQPFSTKSYEFGSFNTCIARAMLDFDVKKVRARDEEAVRRVLSKIAGTSDQEVPEDCDAFINFNNRVHQLACAPLLRESVLNGDIKGVEHMIVQCKVSVSSPYLCGALGEVPLMLATAHGHLEIMEFLLRAKSDPEATDCFGETAMHYAALAGQLDAARLLLRWGARLDKMSHFEETPADVARQNPAMFLGIVTSRLLNFLEDEEKISSLMSAPVLPSLAKKLERQWSLAPAAKPSHALAQPVEAPRQMIMKAGILIGTV